MTNLNYQSGSEATREIRAQRRLSWFGPSRADVWKRLAEEIGGRFEPSFWHGGRVVAEVEPWQVVLDTVHVDKVTYTRMRAPYVNADGFRFCVFRQHLFSGIAERLGFTDINVGYPEFDEPFVIRGNSEPRLRMLFANPTLRQLLLAQPRVRFEVRDDEGFFSKRFPEGVDELRFFVSGVIKDIDQLKQLYDLFAETLNELCRMGSAYKRPAGVEL